MEKTLARPATQPLTSAKGGTLVALVALAVVFLLLNALWPALRTGEFVTEQNLLYVALVLYGAATALYLAFAMVSHEPYVNWASLAVLAGWMANTVAVAHRWYIAGRPPFSNIYEMLLSFTWTLAGLTLWVERRYHVRLVGALTMPVAVISVVLMQLLPSEVRPLVPALQSTWLHIHVTLAMLGYAACAVSFALAVMFLIRDGVRTESFLVWASVLSAAIYAGLGTRLDASGGLRVVAWDPAGHHEIYFAERTPLLVSIPGLGGVFGIIILTLLAAVVLYALSRKRSGGGLLEWANRIFILGVCLQVVALGVFISRAREGFYPSSQADGLFPTSLEASPFITAGLASAFLISLLYLLLAWRREALENMMPSAEILDRLTYKTVGIAFPLLTLMIAAGAYWANRTWGSYWSWDPKETWALITWLVYAGYLHMRITRGWRGRRAAYFAILGFAVVLFTFFGVTYLLPGMHAYA